MTVAHRADRSQTQLAGVNGRGVGDDVEAVTRAVIDETQLDADVDGISTDLATHAGNTLYSALAADSPEVNASTAPVDSGLTVTIPSTGLWAVYGVILWTTAAAADLRLKFTGTTVITAADSFLAEDWNNATFAYDANVDIDTVGAIAHTIPLTINGLLVVTTVGTFKVQHAQHVSDVSNTHLDSGSYIRLQKAS